MPYNKAYINPRPFKNVSIRLDLGGGSLCLEPAPKHSFVVGAVVVFIDTNRNRFGLAVYLLLQALIYLIIEPPNILNIT